MRKRRFVIYKSTHFKNYWITEDHTTPIYQLEKLSHYIKCYASYEDAYQEVKRILKSKIKRYKENIKTLKERR